MQISGDGTRKVMALLQSTSEEQNGSVSPDGRWLAYQSNCSETFEIYVRPFPNAGGGPWQISTQGGRQPLWARDGKELFFVAPDGAIMSATVEATGTVWSAGTPSKMFGGRYVTGDSTSGRTYDVSPDGKRFLMIKPGGSDAAASPPTIVVVQNWRDELKRSLASAR